MAAKEFALYPSYIIINIHDDHAGESRQFLHVSDSKVSPQIDEMFSNS